MGSGERGRLAIEFCRYRLVAAVFLFRRRAARLQHLLEELVPHAPNGLALDAHETPGLRAGSTVAVQRARRDGCHLSDSHVRHQIKMPEMARDRIAMLMRRPLELA